MGPLVPTIVPDTGLGLRTHAVRPGESFWTIAETVVFRTNPTATDREIARYWEELVRANASNMPVPDNPDLLYPGIVLQLPRP